MTEHTHVLLSSRGGLGSDGARGHLSVGIWSQTSLFAGIGSLHLSHGVWPASVGCPSSCRVKARRHAERRALRQGAGLLSEPVPVLFRPYCLVGSGCLSHHFQGPGNTSPPPPILTTSSPGCESRVLVTKGCLSTAMEVHTCRHSAGVWQ